MPIAGPDTVRYGGNTPCVLVQSTSGSLIVLDAGTGIRALPEDRFADSPSIHLLLTHLHMDHIQGLAFFQPLYDRASDVHIWGPPSLAEDLRLQLGRYLSPPLFPSRLRDLPCQLSFHHVHRGTFEIEDWLVTADVICHPGPTVGYRIENGAAALAYLPDHEPALGHDPFPGDPVWTSGYQLTQGADLLVHDTQYSAREYSEHVGWGHTSIADALRFAELTQVKRLVTFHHDPGHDDSTLDRLLDEATSGQDLPFELIAGMEGSRHQLP